MEVPHHPHIEKKNFKEYFSEFLMIFLAVSLALEKLLKQAGNPQLRKHNQDNINQLIFYLHERKSGFVGEIRLLTVQKQYAAALIQLINKEYHLKDE